MSHDSITELQRLVEDFAAAREWQQFHDPKNLSMALASEVGELASVLRWTRNEDSDAVARTARTREKLLEEIGDVGILLLQLCARLNTGFGDAVHAKLALNEERYPVAKSRGRAERHVDPSEESEL